MSSARLRGSTFARSAGALCLALAAALLPAGAGAEQSVWISREGPLRIMPLGDSITAGVGFKGADLGSGGYRGELERLLDAHGYRYAMIGGRSDYSRTVRMRGHEGHPGYVIRSFPSSPAPQLYGAVTKEAIAAYDPDVILLMAGTNDLLRLAKRDPGYTLPNIARSMDALLAQIFFEKPNVDVIVAGIVASPNIGMCDVEHFDGGDDAACGDAATQSLRTLVAAYAARGFHIAFAPGMDAAVPRDKLHFPDGIHPCGEGGYAALARVWLQAIESETDPSDRGTLAGR